MNTKQDTDSPNLFVGKIIDGNKTIKCEVISCVEDDFRIKILEIKWDRLGTYMDLEKTYPLRSCYNSKNGDKYLSGLIGLGKGCRLDLGFGYVIKISF